MRTATRPSESIIIVVGIAFGTRDPRKPARTASSVNIGYVILKRFTKLCAAVGLSRVNIPIN